VQDLSIENLEIFFDNDYQNGFVLLQDKKTAQLIAGLFIAGL
jgi:hypothetical protein